MKRMLKNIVPMHLPSIGYILLKNN